MGYLGVSYSDYFRKTDEVSLKRSSPVTSNSSPLSPLKPDVVAKPKSFVERDFSEAPSFTQPLADHTSTPGYSTQLSCSVRASPKVRAGALGLHSLSRQLCLSLKVAFGGFILAHTLPSSL